MTLQHIDTVIGFVVVMLLLSMLITVLVQMVIAVLGLRGANLLWGVKTLLQQVGVNKNAEDIAEAVLRHPAISHTRNRRATAIHVDELVRLLRDLAANPDSRLKAAAQPPLKTLIEKLSGIDSRPATGRPGIGEALSHSDRRRPRCCGSGSNDGSSGPGRDQLLV